MCRVRTRTSIAAVTTIEGLRAPEVAGRSRARFRFGWRELRGWRLTWSQARRLLVSLILGWAALALTISVLPGVSASTHWDVLLAAALVGVVAAALRPVLTSFALLLGWVGVLIAGVFAQAGLFYLALILSPGIRVAGFWDAFWASWLYAVLIGLGNWFVSAGDETAFLSHVIRHAGGSGPRAGSDDPTPTPGMVVVQIDGLSAPLLRWAVRSGDLPTLSRWVRSGSHTLADWHATLPSTTPASQAGLLHGASAAIPAFRWYEKDSGRLLVASRPADAKVIQERLSDGAGLLADGGVSVSNIFSGDAPTALLTMSGLAGGVRDVTHRRGPSRNFASFLITPYGLVRSLTLTIGEMVKEVYQARRQRMRQIEPRINRGGAYIVLRGVTNVLLRDLNVGLIAEHMMRGANAVFCDFTDYDEIAHHAGPTRPESMASLAGVDRVLAILEHVAEQAQRPYRLVVLSDHGQSQGATFRQRYGRTLEDLVRELMAARMMTASTGREEEWGPVTTFLDQLGTQQGVTGNVTRRVLRARARSGHTHLSQADAAASAPGAAPAGERPDLVVIASGNLGMVYFARRSGRLTVEEIEAAYPGLLAGLADHPGIGFAVALSAAHGLVALGAAGVHFLDEDRVDGEDPLTPFGPRAAADLRRHGRLRHVGDVVLNSRIDPGTDEVAAFEELVGCHGGLGGWQTEALLLHPADLAVDDGPLIGADAVHHQLIRWLEKLGARRLPATVRDVG